MADQSRISALVRDGFAFFTPEHHGINIEKFDQARQAGRELNAALLELPNHSLRRNGEHENDLLLTVRDGTGEHEGKDKKLYLHVARMLRQHPNIGQILQRLDDKARANLKILEEFECFMAGLASEIMADLELTHPELFGRYQYLPERFETSRTVEIPYNASALRFLHYKAESGQEGAAHHLDRCFLTLHCGDVGGELRGHRSFTDREGFNVSPKDGQILVFFGFKVLEVTEGRVFPLLHSALATEAMCREALVYFAHVDVGYPVSSWKKAWRSYCWQQKLNGNAAYAAFYQR